MTSRPWQRPSSRTSLVLASLLTGVGGLDVGPDVVNVLLLLAAVAAGCHGLLARPLPTTAPGRHGDGAAEALAAAAMLAGVLVCGTWLAGQVGSPAWGVGALLGYAGIGLAAVLSELRGRSRWPALVFATVHVAGALVLLAEPVRIDLAVFLRDSGTALLAGRNPYGLTFPDVYGPVRTRLYYGPDVVQDGRIVFGFPYPPVNLLWAVSGVLLGDVRRVFLALQVVATLALRRRAGDGVGRLLAWTPLVGTNSLLVASNSWIEPGVLGFLVLAVLAAGSRRPRLAGAALGLLVTSKQYFAPAAPLLLLVRRTLTPTAAWLVVATGLGTLLPFVLWDPGALYDSLVVLHQSQPTRGDANSLLMLLMSADQVPTWWGALVPLVAGLTTSSLLALRGRTGPGALGASLGLTVLVSVLLSDQVFLNTYYLVAGAFATAAVVEGPGASARGSDARAVVPAVAAAPGHGGHEVTEAEEEPQEQHAVDE